MQKRRLDRADGRYMYTYSFDRPLPEPLPVDEQRSSSEHLELRWNPLLGEYVIVSTGRQDRTFLPPPEYCPLCPTSGEFATELPFTNFEIAVFENRFPSFVHDPPTVEDGGRLERRAQAAGACEVIVYAPDHDATLGSLPPAQGRALVDVWADRHAELAARPEVRYVFIFENRGREIGVTLTHPHGQIYAFPFVPPRVEQERAVAEAHRAEHGTCLLCDLVAQERAHGRRIVAESPGFAAYVPFAARLPYEVHIVATEHRSSLQDLAAAERAALATLLIDVQRTYDALWGFAMPYTMSVHQGMPGADADDHLHIEFAPPYRTRDKMKYLAGVETGAGTFINDTAPEDTARELRGARSRT